jgi:hypothetical protein
MTVPRHLTVRACVIVVAVLACARASAYSVLTHEAIVDSAWDDAIAPALRARFAGLTNDALNQARAYAYGGAIIQDMGYYPFGSELFTDLTHYVRSGDFVIALLRDAVDVDEYAFALGALAHYAADNDGHGIGINRAEPLIYPKIGARFGPFVTYEEDPAAHLKTEFGFDVLEVARHSYPTKAFHDFIGFQVASRVLERAFVETYGLRLGDVFLSEKLAVGSYRYAVSTVIPEMTKVAWATKQQEIAAARPGITREEFVYNLTRMDYAREWGSDHERPGVFARVLSVLIKVVPKVGPFRPLRFRIPPAAAEADFMRSFNATVALFHQLMADLRGGHLALPNRDFDTGQPTSPGEYRLADRTYARLLDRLSRDAFRSVPPALRDNLLAFYRDPGRHDTTRECPRLWRRTVRNVGRLRAIAGKDYADFDPITRRD